MGEGRKEHEDPEAAREREQEWSWSPRSGEGSGSALGHMKRVERLKATWRSVRPGSPVPARDEHPSSSD